MIRPVLIGVALLATVTTAQAGQIVAVLEDSSAFESPSDGAQAKPDKAKKGDTYVLLQTQGEWYQVQFDEKPAWLKKGKQPGQQQSGGGGAQTGGQSGQSGKNNLEVKQDVALKRVIATSLNVRSSPGMTGAILGTLPAGTMVVERGGTSDWRQISFRGRTAHVFGEYLESERGARPTSSDVSSTPTGRSQQPTAGALPGGGSSGLGTPTNQQGQAVQKSPFQDLLSMLTGGGNNGSNGGGDPGSSTPGASTSSPMTSAPPAPVVPGTPEVSTTTTSGSGTSTTRPSSGGTSTTGTSTAGSMWDDEPVSASASSTPTTATTTGTSSRTTTTSETAAGTSTSAAGERGPGASASGGSDGVGYGGAEGSSGGSSEATKKRKAKKKAAEDGGETAKDDGAAGPDGEGTSELPASEEEAVPEEPTLSDEELQLLARIVQGEASQCAHETRVAVAAVVLNRLRSPSFADTIKRVVQQRLQFPSYAPEVREQLLGQPLDEACLDAAREAAGGFDPTDGATHFYNPYLGEKPAWVKRMDKTVRLGERPDDTLEFYRPKPTSAPAATASMFDE